MWKTGHSLMKSKMKETGSPAGGRNHRHLFFGDDYGSDDALYAAIRLIRSVHATGRSVTETADAMPKTVSKYARNCASPIEESRKFCRRGCNHGAVACAEGAGKFYGWCPSRYRRWLVAAPRVQYPGYAGRAGRGRTRQPSASSLPSWTLQLLSAGVSRPTAPGKLIGSQGASASQESDRNH